MRFYYDRQFWLAIYTILVGFTFCVSKEFHMMKCWKHLDHFCWRRKQWNLINVNKYLKGGHKKRTRFFSVVPTDRARSNGHRMKQEVSAEHEERVVCCESDWVVQRGCRGSIFRDTLKLSKHSPEKPLLGGPSWAGGWSKMSLSNSTILLVCDSVILVCSLVKVW